jgi:imidazolonepropionase-like amidohydrolase
MTPLQRLALSLGLLLPSPLLFAATFIHCGEMLDVEDGEMKGPSTLIVDDGVITGIENGMAEVPADASRVDLSGLTCLPGLMDMHTHILWQSSPSSYIDRFTANPADLALQGAMYARRTLEAGFTTIRDLGDSFNVSIALRNSINAGETVGPQDLHLRQVPRHHGRSRGPDQQLARRPDGRPRPARGRGRRHRRSS